MVLKLRRVEKTQPSAKHELLNSYLLFLVFWCLSSLQAFLLLLSMKRQNEVATRKNMTKYQC